MKKSIIYVIAIACATLTFSSCKKEAKSTETEQATEQVTEKASGTSINSIDQAIDEYEKFVDEYIVILKNSAGDLEAAKKMQEMAPKFQEIAQKFQDTSSYTPEQIERLTAIGQKVADAITAK